MTTKLLILAALLAAGPAADTPPTFPWTTFSGSMADSARGATMAMCPEGELYVAFLRHPPAEYVMVYAAASQRIAFYYDGMPDNPQAPFTWIGEGRMDTERIDVVPPLQWSRYNAALHSDPCRTLFPPTL